MSGDGLSMPPSHYFRRQCFTTCEADETGLAATIAALGEDKVMFASDFPHFVKRRLLSDNCIAFYGL